MNKIYIVVTDDRRNGEYTELITEDKEEAIATAQDALKHWLNRPGIKDRYGRLYERGGVIIKEVNSDKPYESMTEDEKEILDGIECYNDVPFVPCFIFRCHESMDRSVYSKFMLPTKDAYDLDTLYKAIKDYGCPFYHNDAAMRPFEIGDDSFVYYTDYDTACGTGYVRVEVSECLVTDKNEEYLDIDDSDYREADYEAND